MTGVMVSSDRCPCHSFTQRKHTDTCCYFKTHSAIWVILLVEEVVVNMLKRPGLGLITKILMLFLTNHCIHIRTTRKNFGVCVRSALLYGREYRTLKKEDKVRLERKDRAMLRLICVEAFWQIKYGFLLPTFGNSATPNIIILVWVYYL